MRHLLLALIGCALLAGSVAGLADLAVAAAQGQASGASPAAFVLAASLGASLALVVFGPLALLLAGWPGRPDRFTRLGILLGAIVLSPTAAPLGRALYKRLPWDSTDLVLSVAGALALLVGAIGLGIFAARLLRASGAGERCLRACALAAIPALLLTLPAAFRVLPAMQPLRATTRGDLAAHNLLLLTIDTLRADALGVMGNPIARTPQIDALARRSTIYPNCVSPSPWTLPSLGSLLTGTYPGEHRLLEDLSTVSEAVPSLAAACQEQGLRTAAIVSNPWLATGALARGFDVFEVAERLECLWSLRGTRVYTFLSKAALRIRELDSAERLTAHATSWIRTGRGAWFLWLHYFDPHLPNWPPSPWDRLYGPPPRRVGSSLTVEEIREDGVASEAAARDEIARLYAGEVARTDHGLGRVLRQIAESSPAGETAIVFTVDHGEELWDHDGYGHGHAMFEEVIRVPLFVTRMTGEEPPIDRRLVRLVDVAPTALATAELETLPEKRFTGTNLLGRGVIPTTYGEAMLYGAEQKYLRTDRWKLVFRPEATEPRLSLFDLENDPGEGRDLAEAQADVRDSLFALLEIWMEHVGSDGAMAARRAGEYLDPSIREQLRALGYIP